MFSKILNLHFLSWQLVSRDDPATLHPAPPPGLHAPSGALTRGPAWPRARPWPAEAREATPCRVQRWPWRRPQFPHTKCRLVEPGRRAVRKPKPHVGPRGRAPGSSHASEQTPRPRAFDGPALVRRFHIDAELRIDTCNYVCNLWRVYAYSRVCNL